MIRTRFHRPLGIDSITSWHRGVAITLFLMLGGCDWYGSSGGNGPVSYTLGGTITGLDSNTGLVLANGGTTLAVNAGATNFAFPTAITGGTAYAVTVNASPRGTDLHGGRRQRHDQRQCEQRGGDLCR